MPSASAKLEKQSSTDTFDPVKQVSTLLDNKIRNLEKRKGKLDGYRADFNSGKELNKDQLSAVEKYDQVLEVLDFSRDLQKNLKTIITDCQKQQKKAAKRELAERQAEQLARLKEVLLFQDLLNNMGTDPARQDFLNQTNGAVKLSEEDLDKLDELYKLVSPERGSETDHQAFEELLAAAAEHLLLLLDGRPKDILGTTYKVLKDMLMRINVSGYFDGSSGKGEAAVEPPAPQEEQMVHSEQEEVVAEVAPPAPPSRVEEAFQGPTLAEEVEQQHQPPREDLVAATHQPIQVDSVYFGTNGAATTNFVAPDVQMQQQQQQQGPLTEVLHGQAPINFLQDSQVDLESPHMDPAVVVAHPMAPPPPMAYHPVPFMAPPSVPVSGQAPPIYEPIPTQTFTNQSFSGNMTNIVVPPASPYIPVNAAGSVSQMGLVGSAPVVAPPKQQESEQQPQKTARTSPEVFMKLSPSDFQASLSSDGIAQSSALYQASEDNEDNCDGFQTQMSNNGSTRQSGGYARGGSRGGPRGAPRAGTNNGYGAGRPRVPYNHESDHTGGRGGYQGNYNRDYGTRRGGTSQRGPGGRGGSRGGPHQQQQGVPRGGSSYRSQPQVQQQ